MRSSIKTVPLGAVVAGIGFATPKKTPSLQTLPEEALIKFFDSRKHSLGC
jgi:hypothetical protein